MSQIILEWSANRVLNCHMDRIVVPFLTTEVLISYAISYTILADMLNYIKSLYRCKTNSTLCKILHLIMFCIHFIKNIAFYIYNERADYVRGV